MRQTPPFRPDRALCRLDHEARSARTMWIPPRGRPATPPAPGAPGRMGGGRYPKVTTGSLASRVPQRACRLTAWKKMMVGFCRSWSTIDGLSAESPADGPDPRGRKAEQVRPWTTRPVATLPHESQCAEGEAEHPKRVFPISPTGDMSLAPLALWACGGGGVRGDPRGRRKGPLKRQRAGSRGLTVGVGSRTEWRSPLSA